MFVLGVTERYLLGETLGYLPPGLPGEGGLTQIFRGPAFWWLALLLPLVFAASSYLGSGRGLGWLLAAYRAGRPVRASEYFRGIIGSLVQLGAGSPWAARGLWPRWACGSAA